MTWTKRTGELLCICGAMMVVSSCQSNTQRFVAAKPPTQSVPTLSAPQKPASPAKPKTSTAKPDPAGNLIAKAEKEYQAGRADYDAGHPEAAKQHFDSAMDMLVESPVELRTDERVQKELDKIVELVSGLDTVAFQEGDEL